MVYAHWNGEAAADFVTPCAEQALEQSLVDETAFLQAYDRAYRQIDREFDLPNRTVNLLIQWIRQNQGRMPERRRNAAELLLLLTPQQLERIEAIVARCFQRDELGSRDADRRSPVAAGTDRTGPRGQEISRVGLTFFGAASSDAVKARASPWRSPHRARIPMTQPTPTRTPARTPTLAACAAALMLGLASAAAVSAAFAASTPAPALATGSAAAAPTTKDIVLLRISTPAAAPAAAQAVQPGDAMAVSVLLESADGTLAPRGTDSVFRTGDRFRVKLLASRSGKVLLFNTTPNGVLQPEPVWQGEVKQGQELVTPRLRLEGRSGVDLLHVVLEPEPAATGAFRWLNDWLAAQKSGSASKDIRLDVQNTESATYLLNPQGRGLVTTVSIAHR